ncbi:hypothetical protein GPECTOR_11g67 [Gonium pectorale]|uniref:Uncharacterized protein n=1 Tax=Gonium pectorale TaxID=33097 RepID=A0A150GQC0_GONPE|nr:hypothetical protein GPECTOR_11g67 [Gonium pectorale]|eukprot:KXZ51942.1 hypothetical protein GPECTOR_11g67 [Gonium pectorale]
MALPPVSGATGAPEDGAPLNSRSASARSFSGLRRRPSERARELYTDYAQQDGCLPVSALGGLLSAVDVSASPDVAQQYVAMVAGPSAEVLTMDQTLAVVGMLSGDPAAFLANGGAASASSSASGARHDLPSAASSSYGGLAPSVAESGGSAARPLRRLLTKNRSYLETGSLHVDEAVVAYMSRLEEHRRRCEGEGRYQEAKVAARRLADLRTAQVEKLRQDLYGSQARELEEVQCVYDEETAKFDGVWENRMREHAANLQKATADLQSSHREQLAAFVADLQRRRPTRARPSRDYLTQREVQDKLAKAQLYGRATQVKTMADELYQADLESTIAAWEAESKLKIAKLQARQQTEYEALQQRGSKGRDELELKRLAEKERRTLRYRNIIMLEMAHLENFLDAQVLAGKATPLKDPGAFRRRREQLFNLSLS